MIDTRFNFRYGLLNTRSISFWELLVILVGSSMICSNSWHSSVSSNIFLLQRLFSLLEPITIEVTKAYDFLIFRIIICIHLSNWVHLVVYIKSGLKMLWLSVVNFNYWTSIIEVVQSRFLGIKHESTCYRNLWRYIYQDFMASWFVFLPLNVISKVEVHKF